MTRDAWLLRAERRYLKLLVRRHGKGTAAAKASGVNRTSLYRLLEKHGLHERQPDTPQPSVYMSTRAFNSFLKLRPTASSSQRNKAGDGQLNQ